VAIDNVLQNVAGAVDLEMVTLLCEHAARMHGSAVGRTICTTIQRLPSVNRRLVDLLTIYAEDPDPVKELALVETQLGPYYGGDLYSAGMNSTRGEAALAAAHILFATDEYDEILAELVESLSRDAIMAVRVCAAEGALALLNRMPDRGLSAAEQIFSAGLAIHDARTTERLLIYTVLRSPDRFGVELHRALKGPDPVARRAGRVWAISMLRDATPPAVPSDVADLATPARVGAAEVFAQDAEIADAPLRILFNDESEEVREQAAGAFRHLKGPTPAVVDDLIEAFLSSDAFDAHFDNLLHSLAGMDALPEASISVCEKVIESAGKDLGDISRARSLSSRDLMTLLLRLYRQGHTQTRGRCLDVIDRLTDLNAYGVANALEAER
jgi:hypothetical protein